MLQLLLSHIIYCVHIIDGPKGKQENSDEGQTGTKVNLIQHTNYESKGENLTTFGLTIVYSQIKLRQRQKISTESKFL